MHKAITPILSAIMLASCAASPDAVAQPEPVRTITVTGQGEAIAAPDMAILSIGVRTEEQTAAAALRQNSTQMAATIEKLLELDVEERDIQTSGLSINPRYNYGNNRSDPRVVGFTASNTLTVKLRDLDSAGAVIDQTVQSGANSLGGIQFTFADPSPLQDQARENAVAKARAKAELLANAAGVRLGEVITINDGYVSTPTPQPMMMRAETASMSADVPIQTGESSLIANVTIIYRIN